MATRPKNKKTKTPKRSSEVDRILKTNLQTGVMTKEDVYFARKFLNVILEAEEELPSIGDESGMQDALPMPVDGSANPDKFTDTQNQADLDASHEDGTSPDAFDTKGNKVKDAESFSNVYVKKCHHWVKQINHFADFLNGIENKESLTTQLNDADRDGSVFKGVTRKIGDNVAKIAGELDRIGQQLGKYVQDAPKKQRELQKLTKIT